MQARLGSLITLHCGDAGVGHTFVSLNKAMSGPDLVTTVVTPSCEPSLRGKDFMEAVPPFLRGVSFRIPSAPRFIAEARFLSLLNRFDAVYLFPGHSRRVLRKLASYRKPIFVERINCHTGMGKMILDEAYSRLGLAPPHAITSRAAADETEDIGFVDYIFCPSPAVMRSYENVGTQAKKLIPSSYGWSPERFPNRFREMPRDASKPCVFLFVGHLSVRKGTHLLLRAWKKSDINGTLMLYGNMEPAIQQTCGGILSRPDVVWHRYSSDLSQAYSAADAFAFPSLEEGSPLVTYEAMAHGLPMLVSPMAAGGVVRDEIDGIVIPPYDEERWIEALRRLSADAELRRQFGEAARKRADEFTWEKVGRRRAGDIIQRLG
jgi:glycosyltransferase involved in cell wall biosynthesis